MQKCLVIGAGGFIGKALCTELLKKYDVLAYDLLRIKEFEHHPNFKYVKGNFCEEKDFLSLLEGVQIVYHMVSTTIPTGNTQGIEEEICDNVLPSIRLLEAIKDSNVKLIFISSAGTIYGSTSEKPACEDDPTHPICGYGVQKKTIESYIELYGYLYNMNYLIARVSNPYGFGQHDNKLQGVIPILIRKLLDDEHVVLYGDTKRDYIFIEDVAQALSLLASYEGSSRILNICCGEAHSLYQVVQLIENEGNKRFKSIEYQEKRIFDLPSVCLDNTLAKKELQWECTTSIVEGIRKTIDFYRKRGNHS